MRTITIIFALWALCFGSKNASSCSKQRCDFLKALLPFFIILHHHFLFAGSSSLLFGDFRALGAPVVMMFFFISGYGLEFKRSSKGIRLKELPLRLRKLFTPTLLPILLYVVCLLFFDDIKHLTISLVKCWYPLPFSWFVVVLAILYIGFYICSQLTKNGKIFLIFFLSYSVFACIVLKIIHAPGHMTYSIMAVFIGALYKHYEEFVMNLLQKRNAKFIVCVFLPILTLAYLFSINNIAILPIPTRYLWTMIIFLVFAYAKVFKSKVTDFLTKISYDIYLCQGIAFVLVPYKDWNFGVSFVAIVLLTVVIATFSHFAHEKIFKR